MPSRMAVLSAYFGLSKTKERRTFSWRALQNRSFRYYFAGSVTSDFGTWLQNTAQVMLAYRLSHSVLVVGLVTCAQFTSPLVLGPWAGVMTDKFGGRRILFATQIAAAGFAGTMAALAFAGHMHTRWLGCGAIASGLAFTFALPARNVTVRRLVPAADVRPAFAMDSVSYNLGRAVAPPICVLLVTTLGFGWAFAANAVSFVIFAVCLRLAGQGQPTERQKKESQLRDGFEASVRDWRIAVLLLMVAAVTVADDPVLVLGPAVAGHLHANADWSGLFIAALGGGTVLGSFRPSTHEPSLRLAATALALLAACMMGFVLSPWLPVTCFAAFGAGVMCLIANSATRTVLATRATPAHEASVMAVWAIAWAGSKPFASLADGLLAGHIGIRATGVLLALPAMLPIAALLALPVLVLAVRRWKPRQDRLVRRRERLASHEWFRCTADKLAVSTTYEIRCPNPRKRLIRAYESAGPLIHNQSGGTAGYPRPRLDKRRMPSVRQRAEVPWRSTTVDRHCSTGTSTTTPGSNRPQRACADGDVGVPPLGFESRLARDAATPMACLAARD